MRAGGVGRPWELSTGQGEFIGGKGHFLGIFSWFSSGPRHDADEGRRLHHAVYTVLLEGATAFLHVPLQFAERLMLLNDQ